MDKIKQYGIFNTSIWRGSLKIRCVRKRSKGRNNFAIGTDRKHRRDSAEGRSRFYESRGCSEEKAS